MSEASEARSKQINRAMALLEQVRQTSSSAQTPLLEEIATILPRLDNEAPTIPFNELSHETLRARNAMPFRRLLNGPLDYIRQLFHGSALIGPGEQWTISMGTDCGFTMDVTLRIQAVGDCEPADANYLKGNAPATENPVATEPSPDSTPAPADDAWSGLLSQLGLRDEKPKPRRRSRKKPEQDEPTPPTE